MTDEKPDKKVDTNTALNLSLLTDNALRVLAPIALGMIGGIWLGNHHGHKQLFAVLGTLIGLAGTGLLLYQMYHGSNRGKNS